MSLWYILAVLVAAGVIVWLINQAPFIDGKFKQLINYAALVIAVLWLLSLFFGPLPDIRIGR